MRRALRRALGSAARDGWAAEEAARTLLFLEELSPRSRRWRSLLPALPPGPRAGLLASLVARLMPATSLWPHMEELLRRGPGEGVQLDDLTTIAVLAGEPLHDRLAALLPEITDPRLHRCIHVQLGRPEPEQMHFLQPLPPPDGPPDAQ
jgi:hypothetical protein